MVSTANNSQGTQNVSTPRCRHHRTHSDVAEHAKTFPSVPERVVGAPCDMPREQRPRVGRGFPREPISQLSTGAHGVHCAWCDRTGGGEGGVGENRHTMLCTREEFCWITKPMKSTLLRGTKVNVNSSKIFHESQPRQKKRDEIIMLVFFNDCHVSRVFCDFFVIF